MAAESSSSDLVQVVALLTAAVAAVPVFRRLGLGSILGYLMAGLVILEAVGILARPLKLKKRRS